jgi:long-chain fatty acid transport protein
MRILSRNKQKLCVGTIALLGASAAAMTAAHAGGFAVREQSAYYQGMSFAGAGTGDTLSSMYWNSAAAASVDGINSETHVTLILPQSEITATSPLPASNPASRSGDIADPAVVPASYANYQINDQLYLGIATNSGFGLVTKPDNTTWVGSAIALTSDVFSININPTIAYKITPQLAVGIGVQIEYLDIRLNNGAPLSRAAELDDIGIGATAGVSWTPTAGTNIGIGYRSAVKFDLEGDYKSVFTGGANRSAQAELTLPEIVTVGIRQSLSERLDLLLGYEWTNWSRVGSIPVEVQGLPAGETLRLEYDNGHFVSAGLEYDYSPDTTLRVGVAWEKSPISDEERNVLLPDSDRIWLSFGATHKLTERATIDIGYSHIFADEAPICRNLSAGAAPCSSAPGVLLKAEAEGSVDIISASFKYKWGGGEPELEPLK